MITSQYGNEIQIDTALYDGESGEYVGCEAVRLIDHERRCYLLHQMRADGGYAEIIRVLDAAPTEEEYGVRDPEDR